MKHNFLAKLLFLAIAISLLLKTAAVFAAVLDVPEKFQEQDQWCWAGASQAIMQYYGTVLTQTAIAGYGTNGYNTWNYLYGSDSVAPYYRKGISMILNNWGFTCTYGEYTMSQVEVQNQIDSSRPFVIRWGWYSGGGHFIDGRGIEGDSVYYMDPWPGEGYKIALYSWVVDNGIHQWTHSLELTTYPSPQTPTVTTTAVSLVTSNSASSGGNVTSDGGASVTAKGVCWSTSANPTTSNSKTTDGTGTGSFTSSITGLSPGTIYHVRAYATNSVGTGYGSDASFTTFYFSTIYVNKDGSCGGKTPCYAIIQEAINDASTGSTIKIAEGTYNESFVLNQSKSLTLQGGWDSSFTTQTSNTTFIKSPKAPQGSLTLQMVTITP